MDDLGDLENEDMVKHLLVAADRYGVERMKILFKSILCNSLDVEIVATKFAAADQHHCSMLNACIEFIISSDRMNDVLASQWHVRLKKSRLAVLVYMFE
jgi:speckle-type POZ protein